MNTPLSPRTGLGCALAAAAIVVGCNDDYVLPTVPTAIPDGSSGWCAVQVLIAEECLACHGDAGLGDLTLNQDPHRALVDVAAATDPSLTLVVPGDPDASFLLAKLTGDLTPALGGVMPPGAGLPEATIALVRTWIADGATDVCDEDVTPGETSRHHPSGFALPTEHGPAAKVQEETCIDCHADDLTGAGDAVSCDACHAEGWRTDCTFCHGDPAEGSGSPPVHISGEDDGRDASFIPHRAHTDGTGLHVAFDCETCHDTPDDVLSDGHLFVGDTTPGVAEVDLGGGLSFEGTWTGTAGTCSDLWCHGNGRGHNGTMDHTSRVTGCDDCHPDQTSGRDAWDRMSGEHEDHLREGVACWECHRATADATGIVDVTKHVDGTVQVALPPGVTRVGLTCTGDCHGEEHDREDWR